MLKCFSTALLYWLCALSNTPQYLKLLFLFDLKLVLLYSSVINKVTVGRRSTQNKSQSFKQYEGWTTNKIQVSQPPSLDYLKDFKTSQGTKQHYTEGDLDYTSPRELQNTNYYVFLVFSAIWWFRMSHKIKGNKHPSKFLYF